MPGDDKFVDCHIGGRPYRMGFDFNVLVDAEKATGENLLEGAARLGAGSSGGQLRGLVYAVLKPHNPRVTLEEAGGLLTKDMPAVMDSLAALFGEEKPAPAALEESANA
jgi:hypothetical protein